MDGKGSTDYQGFSLLYQDSGAPSVQVVELGGLLVLLIFLTTSEAANFMLFHQPTVLGHLCNGFFHRLIFMELQIFYQRFRLRHWSSKFLQCLTEIGKNLPDRLSFLSFIIQGYKFKKRLKRPILMFSLL